MESRPNVGTSRNLSQDGEIVYPKYSKREKVLHLLSSLSMAPLTHCRILRRCTKTFFQTPSSISCMKSTKKILNKLNPNRDSFSVKAFCIARIRYVPPRNWVNELHLLEPMIEVWGGVVRVHCRLDVVSDIYVYERLKLSSCDSNHLHEQGSFAGPDHLVYLVGV